MTNTKGETMSTRQEDVNEAARRLIGWKYGLFIGEHNDDLRDRNDEACGLYNKLVKSITRLDGRVPKEWEN